MNEVLSAMLVAATVLTSLGMSALLAWLTLQWMFHALMSRNNQR